MMMLTIKNTIRGIIFPSSSYHPPIILLSIPYRSRIDPVSIPYCFRIVSVLFPYRFRIGIRKQYGIDTGTIRERYGNDRRNKGEP